MHLKMYASDAFSACLPFSSSALSLHLSLRHISSTLLSPEPSLVFLFHNSHYNRVASSSTSASRFNNVSVLPPPHDSSGPVGQRKGFIQSLVMHDMLYLFNCCMSSLCLSFVFYLNGKCIQIENTFTGTMNLGTQ